MSNAAIQAAAVMHHYPKTGWRLGPVSLEICGGGLTGLIGPNGSGKSTFLSLLAQREHAQGTVRLLGRDTRTFTMRDWAKTVAYLPQQIGMDYDFSVEQTVAFGRYPHSGMMGFLGPRDREVIERCLQETDMAGLRSRLLGELSGGERQRAHMAAVLAQEPQVLFLDEPATALDIHHQVSLYTLLKSCTGNGITVVMATHDLTLTAQFCDDLVLLAGGAIVRHGTPGEVFQRALIQSVYGPNVDVLHHPHSGRPMVVPMQ